MTLPALALRSLRSGDGTRGIYGIRLHQHQPAAFSQQAPGASAWSADSHGREHESSSDAVVGRWFWCLPFLTLAAVFSARRLRRQRERVIYLIQRRVNPVSVCGVCLPNCNMNFHQFRSTKAVWAYLHSGPAVMKLL